MEATAAAGAGKETGGSRRSKRKQAMRGVLGARLAAIINKSSCSWKTRGEPWQAR